MRMAFSEFQPIVDREHNPPLPSLWARRVDKSGESLAPQPYGQTALFFGEEMNAGRWNYALSQGTENQFVERLRCLELSIMVWTGDIAAHILQCLSCGKDPDLKTLSSLYLYVCKCFVGTLSAFGYRAPAMFPSDFGYRVPTANSLRTATEIMASTARSAGLLVETIEQAVLGVMNPKMMACHYLGVPERLMAWMRGVTSAVVVLGLNVDETLQNKE
jgi:hypothetical protein